MVSILCRIDDKLIPLYRVMWVGAVPHFCGSDDCMREGQYEVKLEQDESLWASHDERDLLVQSLEKWQGGLGNDRDSWD